MGVRLREVPAAAGGQWIRQAIATFRRRPGLFLLAFSGMWSAFVLLTLFGLPGVVLFGLAVPLGSLLFMMMTAASLSDLPEHRRFAAAPFAATRTQRRGLAGLCALYCTAVLLLSTLAAQVAGDAMAAYLEAMRAYYAANAPATASMPQASGRLLAALGVLYGGMSLVAVLMWHAPALVHWGGQGAAQALFSSALAMWRTRRALAVYALGWLMLFLGIVGVANLLVLVGLGLLVMFGLLAALLTLSAVFYVSLYFTFTGTFELE